MVKKVESASTLCQHVLLLLLLQPPQIQKRKFEIEIKTHTLVRQRAPHTAAVCEQLVPHAIVLCWDPLPRWVRLGLQNTPQVHSQINNIYNTHTHTQHM